MDSHKETILEIVRYSLLGLSVWLYFFTLLAGYSGWINPEKWALPAMLALGFLPLFVVCVAATVGWNIYNFRSPIAIIGDVVMALLVFPFFTLCPFGSAKLRRADEKVLTVMSYNSFYCNDTQFENPVRSRTLDYIITTYADIVCLQELYSLDAAGTHGKATETQIRRVKQMYPYRVEPGSRELVILSRYPLTMLDGDNGKLFFQYQAVRANVSGTPVTIVNVHMPSFGLSDEERQIVRKMKSRPSDIKDGAEEIRHTIYGKLAQAFAARAQAARVIRHFCDTVKGDLIVCGDFNDVPGSYTYRTVRGDDMRDVYTETAKGYTCTFHAYMMYFHIDQMFYRGDMRALSFRRGVVKSSDHYPIVGTFALPVTSGAKIAL